MCVFACSLFHAILASNLESHFGSLCSFDDDGLSVSVDVLAQHLVGLGLPAIATLLCGLGFAAHLGFSTLSSLLLVLHTLWHL